MVRGSGPTVSTVSSVPTPSRHTTTTTAQSPGSNSNSNVENIMDSPPRGLSKTLATADPLEGPRTTPKSNHGQLSSFRLNPEFESLAMPRKASEQPLNDTGNAAAPNNHANHNNSTSTSSIRQTISGTTTPFHLHTISPPSGALTSSNTTSSAAAAATSAMLEKSVSSRAIAGSNKEVISSTASPSSGTGGSGGPGAPLARSSSRPQQQQQQQAPSHSPAPLPLPHPTSSQPPLRERRDSHSVVSQTSGPGDAWQWQENNDPDDQEQALFEQRLCEDMYGVAVRKINQNGKSSLRYVKCCYVDASEIEQHFNASSSASQGHYHSSNRSVSSRSWSSRNGFSRFLSGGGGTSSSNNSHADPQEFDAHRNLIPGKKVKVLTWGKKKDVKIPVDRFIAVRKGKTTERSKRNVCPASRILSLVTADDYNNGGGATTLDIEAPTRLDRDKFARAFSRFLNIPLIEGDQQSLFTNDMRSVRSDNTPQSFKDPRQPSSVQQMSSQGYTQDFTANSSVPDIAMTTTNSCTTNGSSRKLVPLPVVTTSSGGSLGMSDFGAGSTANCKPPSKPTKISKPKSNSSSNLERSLFPNSARSNPNSHDVSDYQTGSLPSSSQKDSSLGMFQNSSNLNVSGNNVSGHPAVEDNHSNTKTPTKEEATLEIPMTPKVEATPATSSAQVSAPAGDDAGSVVSSITGAGFDQDLVEELHLALEKMRAELEASRAEAARAVKVAEQAIQSAENSNSKDWNSTVTHKAAEAAAVAQKKSAEAMAKARVAEERLEAEKKNALTWKKQLESAEEQAGHWQTRAAAAEVQRYAVAEALESERKKNAQLIAVARNASANGSTAKDPFDPFDSFSGELPTDEVEVERLRSRLAMESARRRKLLDELQDLRGAVRVYCRPHSSSSTELSGSNSTITMASSEVLMLRREGKPCPDNASPSSSGALPLTFEFDGILSTDMEQHDVYAEFEAICASVVEGFKICVMTYGQSSAGKTYTMLGNVEQKSDFSVAITDHGIHLRAMKQLFSVLEHRRDRYTDTVTMTLVDVHDERLVDLLAGTAYSEAHGRVEGSKRTSSRKSESRSDDGTASLQANSVSSSRPKLEIKSNRDGETVILGVLSVNLSSFDDVYRVWTESLAGRSKRLAERDTDPKAYELGSHVIATLKVSSRNIATGVVTSGKIQFVDFASSDVVPRRNANVSSRASACSASILPDDCKFSNKSLNTVSEVVHARSQYQRSVPYRNSTITHVLSDSLEADTKVVLIACVSPDEKDLQNTTCTLKFAQEMRKVVVGKATRHTSTASTAAA